MERQHSSHSTPSASAPATSAFSQPGEPLNSQKVIPVLACVLSQISQKNDLLPLSPKHITVFHALKPPTISIKYYLDRIVKYAYCSPECFVLALVYLDRIIQRNENFFITSLNVHRLLVTSVMVGAKFFDDAYYNNAYYARVGGISCSEINTLELEFLYLINFSLHVTPDVFERYRVELCLHAIQANPARPCSCISSSAGSSYRPSSSSSSLPALPEPENEPVRPKPPALPIPAGSSHHHASFSSVSPTSSSSSQVSSTLHSIPATNGYHHSMHSMAIQDTRSNLVHHMGQPVHREAFVVAS
jgi:hypothetical protein